MAVAAAALADEVRRLGVCGARSWEQLMYAPGQPSDQATPKLPKLLSRHTINRTAPLCAYLQASSLSWQLANDVLALLLGKECEGQDAAAALTALCTALAERLLHLLGKVDDALNDDEQTARICALPLPVLEVRRAARCHAIHCCLEESACRVGCSRQFLPQLGCGTAHFNTRWVAGQATLKKLSLPAQTALPAGASGLKLSAG